MSWDGWFAGACFMYGHFPDMGILPSPDTLQDVSRDSELIVFWGADPILHNVYTGIDYAKPFQFWKELGKKMIVIDPYHNDTAAAYADKWIPIIPGTDAAMAAAVAFQWIQAGTYDQEYLDTHTIGFDEAHLPPIAPKGTSFKRYILGENDGIPKTPEWAEKITGVPARIIVALAKEWAAKPTSLWAMIGGACRRAYAHEFSRIMVTLQAMQGLGKPGVNLIASAINMAGPRDRRQVGPPGYGDGGINGVAREFPQNPVNQEITEILLDQAILNPPVKWNGGRILNMSSADFFAAHEYPAPGCSEIHMIWSRGDTYLNMPNRNRDLQVYQHSSIETIVVQDPFFNRDARYADIVLPVTTNFEREDLTEPSFVGTYMPLAVINNRCAVFHRRCIDPVGESQDDYTIMSELARRLGFEERYTEGNTVDSWLRKMYAKSNVPLTFDELKERGYYAWPATPDYQPCKQLELFYKDPENNPLDTPTGKLEIFSTLLFNHYGADNPEIPPVPHYIPEWEGRYTEGLVEKYPLQLLTTHPKFRFHGKFDDVDFTREIYKVKGPDGYKYEPIVMSPADAKKRGLKDGDIARAFNDRGQILCGVVTTERMAQGVIWISYGSWNDPMEPKPSAIDRAGDSNLLTTSRPMSAHHLGYAVNSTLVEVEAADLDRLAELYPEGLAGKFSTWNRE
jgi:trimethylamine-N-oxide reductase (cytochrome c)